VALYADIVEIQAPSSARAGESVSITARVKNLATYAIYVATAGKYDDTVFNLEPDYDIAIVGATYPFYGSLTMPNKKVRVYVWSYYWTGSAWQVDDEAYVDISLAELKSEVSQFQIKDYVKV